MDLTQPRQLSYCLLYGSAGILAISAALPWATVAGLAELRLQAQGVVFLMILAGLYAFAGYHVSRGARFTKKTRRRLWGLNVAVGVVIAAFYSNVSDANLSLYSTPAVGTYAAGLAAVIGAVGTLQLHRSSA